MAYLEAGFKNACLTVTVNKQTLVYFLKKSLVQIIFRLIFSDGKEQYIQLFYYFFLRKNRVVFARL